MERATYRNQPTAFRVASVLRIEGRNALCELQTGGLMSVGWVNVDAFPPGDPCWRALPATDRDRLQFEYRRGKPSDDARRRQHQLDELRARRDEMVRRRTLASPTAQLREEHARLKFTQAAIARRKPSR